MKMKNLFLICFLMIYCAGSVTGKDVLPEFKILETHPFTNIFSNQENDELRYELDIQITSSSPVKEWSKNPEIEVSAQGKLCFQFGMPGPEEYINVGLLDQSNSRSMAFLSSEDGLKPQISPGAGGFVMHLWHPKIYYLKTYLQPEFAPQENGSYIIDLNLHAYDMVLIYNSQLITLRPDCSKKKIATIHWAPKGKFTLPALSPTIPELKALPNSIPGTIEQIERNIEFLDKKNIRKEIHAKINEIINTDNDSVPLLLFENVKMEDCDYEAIMVTSKKIIRAKLGPKLLKISHIETTPELIARIKEYVEKPELHVGAANFAGDGIPISFITVWGQGHSPKTIAVYLLVDVIDSIKLERNPTNHDFFEKYKDIANIYVSSSK